MHVCTSPLVSPLEPMSQYELVTFICDSCDSCDSCGTRDFPTTWRGRQTSQLYGVINKNRDYTS